MADEINPFYSIGSRLTQSDGTVVKRVVQLTGDSITIGASIDIKGNVSAPTLSIASNLNVNNLSFQNYGVLDISSATISWPKKITPPALGNALTVPSKTTGNAFSVNSTASVMNIRGNTLFSGGDITCDFDNINFTGNAASSSRNYTTIAGGVIPLCLCNNEHPGGMAMFYGTSPGSGPWLWKAGATISFHDGAAYISGNDVSGNPRSATIETVYLCSFTCSPDSDNLSFGRGDSPFSETCTYKALTPIPCNGNDVIFLAMRV